MLTCNMIKARMIQAADSDISSTFTTMMAVVEMLSQLGLQQIISARNSEGSQFHPALWSFQMLREMIAGAVLLFAVGLLADLLNVPQAA